MNTSSRDQIILRRATHVHSLNFNMPQENNASILQGMQRVRDDLHFCNMRCRTLDPGRCLPALYLAWKSEGAPAAHSRLNRSEWIDTFVFF